MQFTNNTHPIDQDLPEIDLAEVPKLKKEKPQLKRSPISPVPLPTKVLLIGAGVLVFITIIWLSLLGSYPQSDAAETSAPFTSEVEGNSVQGAILNPENSIPTVIEVNQPPVHAPEQGEAQYQQLYSEVNFLKQQLATLSSSSDTDYSSEAQLQMSQIQEHYAQTASAIEQLDKRVHAMEKQFSELASVVQSQDQVKAKKLPFSLISIDLWNGKPYAAATLDNKVTLIAVGDKLMDWQVDYLDFSTQKAIFVNANNEFVEVGVR